MVVVDLKAGQVWEIQKLTHAIEEIPVYGHPDTFSAKIVDQTMRHVNGRSG
jgi:hypothetical protein